MRSAASPRSLKETLKSQHVIEKNRPRRGTAASLKRTKSDIVEIVAFLDRQGRAVGEGTEAVRKAAPRPASRKKTECLRLVRRMSDQWR